MSTSKEKSGEDKEHKKSEERSFEKGNVDNDATSEGNGADYMDVEAAYSITSSSSSSNTTSASSSPDRQARSASPRKEKKKQNGQRGALLGSVRQMQGSGDRKETGGSDRRPHKPSYRPPYKKQGGGDVEDFKEVEEPMDSIKDLVKVAKAQVNKPVFVNITLPVIQLPL